MSGSAAFEINTGTVLPSAPQAGDKIAVSRVVTTGGTSVATPFALDISTAFVLSPATAGSAGQVLSWSGSAPVWTAQLQIGIASGTARDAALAIAAENAAAAAAAAAQTTANGASTAASSAQTTATGAATTAAAAQTAANGAATTAAAAVPKSSVPVSAPLLGTSGTGAFQQIALGSGLTLSGGVLSSNGTGTGSGRAPIVLPAGVAATISASPGLTKISGGTGPTTFTLPSMAAVVAAGGNGQPFIIKDKGVAGTSPQTIAAPTGTLIDGAASIVLNTNFQAVTLVPDTANNDWSRV